MSAKTDLMREKGSFLVLERNVVAHTVLREMKSGVAEVERASGNRMSMF